MGPRPEPPSYAHVKGLAVKALHAARTQRRHAVIRHSLSVAYRAWAEEAEMEIAGFTDIELRPTRWRRGRKLKTREVPLVGSTRTAPTPKGMKLKWVVRRGKEML
eukprot:2636359-Karenia_brevis.AAC.1